MTKFKLYDSDTDKDDSEAGFYSKMFISLKRLNSNNTCAGIINRTVKSVNFEQKLILCTDNIEYGFKDLLWT